MIFVDQGQTRSSTAGRGDPRISGVYYQQTTAAGSARTKLGVGQALSAADRRRADGNIHFAFTDVLNLLARYPHPDGAIPSRGF
jgi:hypothetical protein